MTIVLSALAGALAVGGFQLAFLFWLNVASPPHRKDWPVFLLMMVFLCLSAFLFFAAGFMTSREGFCAVTNGVAAGTNVTLRIPEGIFTAINARRKSG